MITRRDFLKMAGTASVVGALKPDFALADVMNTFSEVNKLPGGEVLIYSISFRR